MSHPEPDVGNRSERVDVDADVVIGYGPDAGPAEIGAGSTVRSGSVIYGDVEIGEDCRTGHRVTIREGTTVGESVLIGTNAVIDGRVRIGSRVSIQTGAYLPPGTTVGDDVFIGPYAVLTNDRYPVRVDEELEGPTLADHVSVGANATVLPGLELGRCAFVAAGAVVTDDVPPETLAVGNPAKHRPLPERLRGGNRIR